MTQRSPREIRENFKRQEALLKEAKERQAEALRKAQERLKAKRNK